MKKPKGFRKECLTIDQIRMALSSFETNPLEGLRDYALFNLLVRTGLRTVEVARAIVGASLIQAQAMARHSDPKMTMIYFHNQEQIKSGTECYVII